DLADRKPFVRTFEFLQADNVGRRFGEPSQQDRQAAVDAGDVIGGDLHGASPCSTTRGSAYGSPEIPRLHLDPVDVQVRDVDVAGPEALRRQFAWIERGTAMMEIVAAAVGQGEGLVAVPDAGEFGRQVGQRAGDEMHDFPFALDLALHGEHAGAENGAAMLLEDLWP